jgi:putative transposase
VGLSCRFTTGTIRVEPDRRHVTLPGRDGTGFVANPRHHRVAHLWADGLAKLTTALAAHAGTLVVEDLHVAGMLRNRRPARRSADAGWGMLRRQLAYKTTWRGGKLHVADRWLTGTVHRQRWTANRVCLLTVSTLDSQRV